MISVCEKRGVLPQATPIEQWHRVRSNPLDLFQPSVEEREAAHQVREHLEKLDQEGAFDRIEKRRLALHIQKVISQLVEDDFLYEFDKELHVRFESLIYPYLYNLKSRRAISDFKIISYFKANKSSFENDFCADIYVKPAKAMSYISLNFIATSTSVNYDQIVGIF